MIMRTKRAGFTLLEVLIALAILAISSLAIIRQNNQSLVHIQQLQLKTKASLIAENEMTLLQIMPQWPGLGARSSSTQFAGGQWQVQTTVSSTSDKDFRKIEVGVYAEPSSNAAPLILLTSYRGRY